MLHPSVQACLFAYMTEAGHADDLDAPLFLATSGKKFVRRALSSDQIYRLIVSYGAKENIRLTPHSLRSTFITKALANGAPIELVAQTVGHSKISTTSLYNHNWVNINNSPINKVDYS